MRVLAVVLSCLVLSLVSTSAAALAPEEIVDPRPGSHVVDPDHALDAAALADIEASVARAAVGGELFVVVVNSTDGVVARTWTTQLFNRLRLDSSARNRGVVLMAAIADRKAEIVLGDGFDIASTTRITDEIMANAVIAQFKRGDPRGAIVDGAAAIADRVLAPPPPAAVVSETAPVDVITPELAKAIAAAKRSKQLKAVVDPRPKRSLLDLTKTLKPGDRAAFDLLVADASEGIEPVFVVVKDIGKHQPRAFALAVFDKLSLTSPRSVLVFGVAAPRQIEIVHGAGFPAFTAPLFTAMAITTAAEARHDGLGVGLLAAGNAVVDVGRVITTTTAQLVAAQRIAEEAARDEAEAVARVRAERQAVWEQEQLTRRENEHGVGFYAGGVGALGACGLGLREALRRRPRKCKKCKVGMHRLNEADDDKHLQEGERAEERLGSVDYDIWACATCGDVLKTRWGAIFTSYSRCNGCSWKTMSSTSRTLHAATEYSTGLAEVSEHCSHCGRSHSYTRTIPRKPKPTASSSSSSGFSSGGGGGGGSSSGGWQLRLVVSLVEKPADQLSLSSGGP